LKRYLDRVVPLSISRANHVLADSQATKDDLVALYDVSPDKVTVLLSGVNPRFKPAPQHEIDRVTAKYHLEGVTYAFSLGTVQPRKNYARLIAALRQFRDSGTDLHLAIAGGKGWLEDPIYRAIDDFDMQKYVHFLGFVDEHDLSALYSGSICFVFPSLYEGFGLPLLEAMACHTPVITSNISSLPEVVGDAGITVDPYDVDAIATAIGRLVSDDLLRKTLIERGAQRIQQFTWDRSARQLIEIYHHLLMN
jgi:glycosyltransferase involved in cell wall biosynthesis